MAGPLAPYARGLAGELARLGFTELSARGQLGLAAHLNRWLDAARLGTAELTGATVGAYLVSRRASGHTAYLMPKALAPLLGYLRALGLAPDAELRAPRDRAEELLERYRCYLLGERGLQAPVYGTIRGSDERAVAGPESFAQRPVKQFRLGIEGVASRSAPKIGHRRSQNRAKRTQASQHIRTSAR